MIKAIFLDYTGTITKERCDAVKSIVVRILKNSVLNTPEEVLSYLWSGVRKMEDSSYQDTYKTEDELVDILLKKCEEEIGLEENLEELHMLIREFWSNAPVYSDAKELFEKCPLPIYVITNNCVQYVKKCMDNNGLKPAGIICGDMVKAYKPHKELFEKALEVSGLRANEVIHIGDSMSSDVKGALSADVTPILIDREGKIEKSDVMIIRNLTEILNLKCQME